jgi:hypothetical protein
MRSITGCAQAARYRGKVVAGPKGNVFWMRRCSGRGPLAQDQTEQDVGIAGRLLRLVFIGVVLS